MSSDIRDVLEQLRFELNYLEQISDRVASGEMQIFSPFRDNNICPNFNDPLKRHTCHECLLYDFVPEEKRIEDNPCQHIVVTPEGESIKQLLEAGDQKRLVDSMCGWLRETISKLECAQISGRQQFGSQPDATY
ncbi:MAG TPA: hypothetical protein VMU24_06875 [Candidatus Acidoferrales bacterium]|nr:hypothetical protein [Candidatus Acidoferrales bacterium]